MFYIYLKNQWVHHAPSYLNPDSQKVRLEPTQIGQSKWSRPKVNPELRNQVKQRPTMAANEIMSKNIHTIEHTSSLKECDNLMKRHNINHLIINRENFFYGVLSYRDLAQYKKIPESSKLSVNKLVTTVVIGAEENAPLGACALVLEHENINCLPILGEDLEVIGILTSKDLLAMFAKLMP